VHPAGLALALLLPLAQLRAAAPAPPAWAAPHEALMTALDAARVRAIQGSRQAFYFEDDRRWLCLAGTRGARCYLWPERAPRVLGVEGDAERPTLRVDRGRIELRPRQGGRVLGIMRVAPVAAEESYTQPPSRRPREERAPRASRRGLPAELKPVEDERAARVASAVAGCATDGELTMASSEQAGASLISIAELEESGETTRAWTCQRAAGVRRCAETRLSAFRPLAPPAPDGWLLLASHFGHRWSSLELAWVSARGPELAVATLDVGGADGQGEACTFAPGYCVFMEGRWTPFEVLAPGCVRIASSILWSATHVRMGDRWLRESRHPAPAEFRPAAGTYRPDPDRGVWIQAACGC
jgi:hypothetical protein